VSGCAVDGVLVINEECAAGSGCFPGDAPGYPVTVTAGGSYLLTSNLQGQTGLAGIELATSDVTLDMNGFQLIGTSGTLHGITTTNQPLTRSNLRLVNGVIRNWGGSGVDFAAGQNVFIEDVKSSNNGGDGFHSLELTTFTNCVARGNGGDGFRTEGHTAIVRGVLAQSNTQGIQVGNRSIVVESVSENNAAEGISCADACVIRNNTVGSNQVGIRFNFAGSTLIGNTVRSNQETGVIPVGPMLLDQNVITDNNQSGGGFPNVAACPTCVFGTNVAP
jgi:parallel beta-helix repeat protein